MILGIPLLITVILLKVFIRPLYILSLFDLYSEYIMETQQKIIAPQKNKLAQTALWFFVFLILLVIFIILFREELGIMELLATPHNSTN